MGDESDGFGDWGLQVSSCSVACCCLTVIAAKILKRFGGRSRSAEQLVVVPQTSMEMLGHWSHHQG